MNTVTDAVAATRTVNMFIKPFYQPKMGMPLALVVFLVIKCITCTLGGYHLQLGTCTVVVLYYIYYIMYITNVTY